MLSMLTFFVTSRVQSIQQLPSNTDKSMISEQFGDPVGGTAELKTRRGWTNLDASRSKSRALRGTYG